MNETIQELTERVIATKFPQLLSKWEKQNSHKYEFFFPTDMENEPMIRLVLYLRNTNTKYTLDFPLKIEDVKLASITKIADPLR